jgi:ABC-2 type transport system ATP-binding protein
MDEAERLADRIAIIAAGRIVASGTPQTLGDRNLSAARISFTLPDGTYARDLPEPLAERSQDPGARRLLIQSHTVAADLHALSGWALARGFDLDDLDVTRPTLEDVYLALTRSDTASETARS